MGSEFHLIEQFFTRENHAKLSIGDDAAIVQVPPDYELLSTTDAMVEGIHFLPDDDPYAIGYKLMAVNLSDIAAMGGNPKWASLSLGVPSIDETWLEAFSCGLFSLAARHKVALIGGDTVRSQLIHCSLHLMGIVPNNKAILRSGAQVGDLIFVTGTLGGAAFELEQKLRQNIDATQFSYLHYPDPPTHFAQKLLGLAHAMIDISDGLWQDLSHVLKASQVGAIIDANTLPFATKIAEHPMRQNYALSGGEDYQLCFTINEKDAKILNGYDMMITCIGCIVEGNKLDVKNLKHPIQHHGFSHF